MLLTTFYKGDGSSMRAEIHENKNNVYKVSFYGPNGEKLADKLFENKSIHYVQDAAENWLNGIKILNG